MCELEAARGLAAVSSSSSALTVSDRVYIVLTYATYVVLVVIVSTLLFVLGVAVVVVQEALRVMGRTLRGMIPRQKPGVERRPGIFGAPIAAPARRSYASTARS